MTAHDRSCLLVIACMWHADGRLGGGHGGRTGVGLFAEPTRDAMPPRPYSPLSAARSSSHLVTARYGLVLQALGSALSPRPKSGGNTRQRRGAAGQLSLL